MNKLINWLMLVGAYFRLNLRLHLEYRGAFLSQAVAMIVNDSIWIVFWNGSFSIAFRFCTVGIRRMCSPSGLSRLPALASPPLYSATRFSLQALITRGQLDAWMLYPRLLLPHLALGEMVPSATGDAIFGYVLFTAFVQTGPAALCPVCAVYDNGGNCVYSRISHGGELEFLCR